MHRRSNPLVLVTLVFALSLGVVFAQNRLTIGSGGEISSLDPRLATDIYSFQVSNMILEPLVTFGIDLGLKPRLATDWSLSDDGTEITFTLREGVLFHHGRAFTAEDVVYTFETVLDEDFGAPNRDLYEDISEIEAQGDTTVIFRLSEANSFLINNIARMPIIPADLGDDDFASNPVGTGPMQFESIVRDDRTTLVAFDDYWGGRAQVDEVVVRPIPEDGTRLLALEGGEIDITQSNIQATELARLEQDDSLVLQRTPGTGYTYVAFNTQVEPLGDVRVRQAISHLIPREAIVEQVLEGVGTPGITMLSPDTPWFNPDVARYDYDPERAQELLAEAGYEDGFSIGLYASENPVRIQLAEILQNELAQVGIEVDVTIEEFGTFLDRVQGSDDYDMFILSWGGQLDPDRAMVRQFSSTGSANYVYYSNSRLDELLQQGRRVTSDSDESVAIYQEAQAIVLEDAPYAFVFYTEELALHQPNLSNWQIHPYSANAWQDVHLISKTQ